MDIFCDCCRELEDGRNTATHLALKRGWQRLILELRDLVDGRLGHAARLLNAGRRIGSVRYNGSGA
jgi:hypothetical protein